ncbi:unnamed protein product [Brassica oleracea var. botrytis]
MEKNGVKESNIYGSQINICFLFFQSIKRRKYNDVELFIFLRSMFF